VRNTSSLLSTVMVLVLVGVVIYLAGVLMCHGKRYRED
jgi:hypothetical protein